MTKQIDPGCTHPFACNSVIFTTLNYVYPLQWSDCIETQPSQKEQGEDGKIEMSLMHFHVSQTFIHTFHTVI